MAKIIKAPPIQRDSSIDKIKNALLVAKKEMGNGELETAKIS